MSDKRYTDEFKIEAVKQITERGHTVQDVALRLLGRDMKNVSDDLKYLAELGLVSLNKAAEGNGRKVAPRVNYEKIRLEIAI